MKNNSDAHGLQRSFINIILLSFALLTVGISQTAAQSGSCTTVALGASQDITAFSVCKKVTLNSVPGPGAVSICVPTNIDAAQWQSFYDNPPAGVTIGPCSGGCSGYSYGGYCYFRSANVTPSPAESCDTVCASQGGCNAAGTRYIGSDDSSGTRCAAVGTALVGSAVSVMNNTGYPDGCNVNSFKGGWIGVNYYDITSTCAAVNVFGRVCACNGSGGSAPCNLPWGGQTAHNTSVTAYAAAAGTPTCTSETRTCTNGTLSGSYTASACTAGCALPWGGYIASGASVTAYSVPSHANCASVSETRTCTSGTLSGSYTNETCTAGGPCSGYSAFGYCYYFSGSGQSCDAGCASRGGCNAAGTDRLSMNGTDAECQAVSAAMGQTWDAGLAAGSSTVGCNTHVGARGLLRIQRHTVAQSCAATISQGSRICACNGTPDVQTFLASGTWTKPTGGANAYIQCWGGGGGGHKDTTSCNNGGGGGGAYAEATIALSSLPATVSVTIGAGGAPNAHGAATTFGAYLTANAGATSPNSSGGGGGAGSIGAYNGGAGGSNNVGAASTYGGGGGGGGGCALRAGGASTYGGAGGASASSSTGAAVNGTVPGGGGGASRNGAGGWGANGKCIVTVN